MTARIFKCPLGKKEVILSSIIILMTISLLTYIIINSYELVNIILSFVCFLVLIIIILYVPTKLVISDDGITVKRILLPKLIPFEDIIAIKERENGWDGDIRLLGSGGFLGYFGWFRSRDMGKYFAYVTNVNNSFWVISSKRVYLLSCNNHKEAIELISKKL